MPYAFNLDTSVDPPICLPTWLDPLDMIDVTCVGHPFRVFFDPKTGVTHDGLTYYNESKKHGLVN